MRLPYPTRMADHVFGRGLASLRNANDGIPIVYISTEHAIYARGTFRLVATVGRAPNPLATCTLGGNMQCMYVPPRPMPGPVHDCPKPELGLRMVTAVLAAARTHLPSTLAARLVTSELVPYASRFAIEVRHREGGGRGVITLTVVNGDLAPRVTSPLLGAPSAANRVVRAALEHAIADYLASR
jgi:hypothetical protein